MNTTLSHCVTHKHYPQKQTKVSQKIPQKKKLNMAATSSYVAFTKYSLLDFKTSYQKIRNKFFIKCQEQQTETQTEQKPEVEGEVEKEQPKSTPLRPAEKQLNVKSKNMGREYGSQWLSSTTRHVRIFAAYIDPETWAFDQTQMDKLTLILDPTNEFEWTPETCNMVYSYFQELVDHYEGAPLTEYTLRLIGSDVEHYIRKLLYDGEIKYNMNSRVLNFSMGKPRVGFSYNDVKLEDVNK